MQAQIAVCGVFDGGLRRGVEAEAGEHHVVVAGAVGVAHHLLHLPRGDVAGLRADADGDPARLPGAVAPLALGVDQRRAGDRVEPLEALLLVGGKLHAARLEQADHLVQVRLGVDGRRGPVFGAEAVQLLRRAADRRVRPLFQRDHPFHRERPGHAHRVLDDGRLVDQLLGLGVGGDAGVHLIHLRPPRGAVFRQRLLQRLRPIGVGVERRLPLPPLAVRNLLAILGRLPGGDRLERAARADGSDQVGRGVRQQPAPHVRVGDGVGPVAAVLGDQFLGECALRVRGDRGEIAVERGERRGQDRFVAGEDRIERGVAGDALERDVRHGAAVEGEPLAVRPAVAVGSLDPGSVRVARHVLGAQFAQPVVVEARGQQPMLGQRQRHPAGVDGDPAPPPLLGDERRRAAPAGRIEHQVAGVGRHQQTALHDQRMGLDDVLLLRAEAADTGVRPARTDREARSVVEVPHVARRVADADEAVGVLQPFDALGVGLPAALARRGNRPAVELERKHGRLVAGLRPDVTVRKPPSCRFVVGFAEPTVGAHRIAVLRRARFAADALHERPAKPDLFDVLGEPDQMIERLVEKPAAQPRRLGELDGHHEVVDAEHLIHQQTNAVQVLVADLHEDAAGVAEQLAGHRQAVAQVGEIGVDAERPGVAVRLDHLRLAGQVLLPVLDVALAELRLKVGGEPDAVGRIDVDHLHLAGQVLAVGQARHHLQRVAQDHPVGPVDVVAVELHRPRVVELRVGEQIALHVLPREHPQNRLRGDPLVHVQRHRLDLEPRPLPLPRPLKPRLMPPQRLRQRRLTLRERPPPRRRKQLRQPIRRPRVRRRPQRRRQMRIVLIPHRRLRAHLPLRRQPRRRNILPRRRIRNRRHGVRGATVGSGTGGCVPRFRHYFILSSVAATCKTIQDDQYL